MGTVPDASALLVGVTPGQRAPSSQPEAVIPVEVRPPRPTKKAAPTRILQPGDLICGDCGEGNAPSRRFCSRCGSSLVTAEKVHIPWWKRIFRRRPKQAATAAEAEAALAGTKKRKRSPLAKLMPLVRRVIPVVLLVGGVVYASVTPFRTYVNTRANAAYTWGMGFIHPQYTPVHPLQVTDGAELKGHPGSALSDGFTNTFWAAPVGDKAFVTMKFDHPVDVSRALIRIGISGNFQGADRPQTLHLVFSTGKTQDISLDDKADPQEVKFKAGGKVTSIEIHVASVYRAQSDSVAITEIELFSKK
jgi:hypothetical protein